MSQAGGFSGTPRTFDVSNARQKASSTTSSCQLKIVGSEDVRHVATIRAALAPE
jgi:hypothetical protein